VLFAVPGAAGITRSAAAMAMADSRKVMWIPTCAKIVFDRDRLDHVAQCVFVAHGGEQQVIELLPEEPNVHGLRDDEAQIKRQLQPAAREDEIWKRPQRLQCAFFR